MWRERHEAWTLYTGAIDLDVHDGSTDGAMVSINVAWLREECSRRSPKFLMGSG